MQSMRHGIPISTVLDDVRSRLASAVEGEDTEVLRAQLLHALSHELGMEERVRAAARRLLELEGGPTGPWRRKLLRERLEKLLASTEATTVAATAVADASAPEDR